MVVAERANHAMLMSTPPKRSLPRFLSLGLNQDYDVTVFDFRRLRHLCPTLS
jgi:hypothetical protein